MIFENSEINIAELPKLEEGEFVQLDINYLKVSYIGNAIFFSILLLGIIITYFTSKIDRYPWVMLGISTFWLVWLISSFVLTKMGYSIRGYKVREKDIIHRRGVIFKNITSIPFNRVQHCEISQGPIQRIFDLHTIQIFTAGGSTSDLSIPGLKGDTAQKIKDFIIKKTIEETV